MQEGKFTPKLIAPCGMNCGICVAFFGYTMKGGKRKHPCNSCRSRDNIHFLRRGRCAFLKKHCDKLATKQIEYCYECTGFPCVKLEALDKRYRDKYGMSMIENLRCIQTNGIKHFLEYEQERWKCPTCDGIVCVHNNKCYSCDTIIEG